MNNTDFVLYGGSALGVVLVFAFAYYLVKKLQRHGETHKPQVMSKINDYYSTQDSSKPTINY